MVDLWMSLHGVVLLVRICKYKASQNVCVRVGMDSAGAVYSDGTCSAVALFLFEGCFFFTKKVTAT